MTNINKFILGFRRYILHLLYHTHPLSLWCLGMLLRLWALLIRRSKHAGSYVTLYPNADKAKVLEYS